MKFYVYGLQAIGLPTGNVKIGFSSNPISRISALEPGALGERLRSIFLTDAGQTIDDARKMEKAYHQKFSLDRINREWFKFNELMLVWLPDNGIIIYKDLGIPATNTVAAQKLEIGDLSIFKQSIVQTPLRTIATKSGDLTPALTVQNITQRITAAQLCVAHLVAPPRSVPQNAAALLIAPQRSNKTLSFDYSGAAPLASAQCDAAHLASPRRLSTQR